MLKYENGYREFFTLQTGMYLVDNVLTKIEFVKSYEDKHFLDIILVDGIKYDVEYINADNYRLMRSLGMFEKDIRFVIITECCKNKGEII